MVMTIMMWLCSGGDKGISLQNLIGPNYSRRDLIQINFGSRHPLNGLDQSLSSVQFLIMILFASEAGAEIICKIELNWADVCPFLQAETICNKETSA